MSLPNLETTFGYRCLDQVKDCENRIRVLENSEYLNQPKSILKSLQIGKLRQKLFSKINVLPMTFDNEVKDYDKTYSSTTQNEYENGGVSSPWNDRRHSTKYLIDSVEKMSSSLPSSPKFFSSLRQRSRPTKNIFSEFVKNDNCDHEYYDPPPYNNDQSPTLISSPNLSCFSSPFHSTNMNQIQKVNRCEFYVPTSSIPFQEIREIVLLKEKSEKYGFKIQKIGMGIFITNVLPDSPTVKAGLKVGDEIILLNNLQICNLSNEEMIEQIRSAETFLKVSFKPRLVIMRLRDVIIRKVNGRLGIRLQKRVEGLFLAIVVPDSPASRAGLKEGDELLKINNEIVLDWSQEKVTQYLRDISTEENDLLLIVREYVPMAHIIPTTNTYDRGLDEFNEISTGINMTLPYCISDKGFNNFT